ncbi:MAG TPA: translocation/assembly module TamB domain-containing protein [Kofleriaceae bacterium]|nr:translocation/assembly module TamB domain-containing protein [Kofleriaceae bacterium]
MTVGRAIARGSLWAVIAASVIVIAAILVLHTDWARDAIRRRLVSEINASIRGDVTIDEVDGSPLSRIVLRGVTLVDPRGERVAHVRWMAIDYAPLELLAGDLVAEEVAIKGATLWLRPMASGQLNLSAAIAPATPEGSRGSNGTAIHIAKLTVTGGEIDHRLVSARDIEATGTVSAAAGKIAATLTGAHAVVYGPGATATAISLRGKLHADEAWFAVTDLVATTDGGAVIVPAMVRSRASGALAGAFSTVAERGLLAHLGVRAPAMNGHGLVTAQNDRSPIDLSLSGSAADLAFDARATASRQPFAVTADAILSGQISGYPIGRVSTHASLENGRVRGRFRATLRGATARGHATVDLGDNPTVRQARFSATIDDLGALLPDAAGTATIRGSARGPITRLTGRVHASARNLSAGGTDLGRAEAEVVVRGRRARATFTVGTRRTPYAATVTATTRLPSRGPLSLSLPRIRLRTRDIQWRGSARLLASRTGIRIRRAALTSPAGSITAAATLALPAKTIAGNVQATTSLAALSRALDLGVPITGRITARASARGSLRQPVIDFQARGDGIRLAGVNVTAMDVTGGLTAATWSVAATVDQGQGKLSATARGGWHGEDVLAHVIVHRFQLAVLTPLIARAQDTVVKVAGVADGELMMTGAPPRGWLEIQRGLIQLRKGLQPLTGVHARADLDGGDFSLTANARSDGGTIKLAGTGTVGQRALETFSLDLSVTNLPFISGSTRTIIDARARARGEHRPGLTTAEVTLEDTTVRAIGPEGDRSLHGTGDLQDVVYVERLSSRAATRHLLDAVEMAPKRLIRAHVVAPDGIRIIAQHRADARVAVDLVTTVASGELFVSGDIDVQTGWVELFDRRYTINSGRITLAGQLPPDPQLNLLLAHKFDELTLFVRVTGTMSNPEVTLSADPDHHSAAELLGIVLGGEPQRVGARSIEGEARVAASALLSGAIQSVIKSRLPIDAVRLGSDELGGGIDYVAVGEWLTDDVFIAYRRRFDANRAGTVENENEAALEYHFLDNWVLEASFGDQSVAAGDILWIKRF